MAEKENTLKDLDFDGFKYTIDTDIVDDMDFLELTDQIENGAIQKYPTLVKKFLGEEQYKKLREYMLKKHGKFSATKCGDFFEFTIKSLDPKD